MFITIPEELEELRSLVSISEVRECYTKTLQGASKKMSDSKIWLLGAYRDCLLLTMILGTFV